MKDNIGKEVIITLVICAVAYLFGAFCNASFDLKEWEPAGRVCIGLAAIVVIAIVCVERAIES